MIRREPAAIAFPLRVRSQVQLGSAGVRPFVAFPSPSHASQTCRPFVFGWDALKRIPDPSCHGRELRLPDARHPAFGSLSAPGMRPMKPFSTARRCLKDTCAAAGEPQLTLQIRPASVDELVDVVGGPWRGSLCALLLTYVPLDVHQMVDTGCKSSSLYGFRRIGNSRSFMGINCLLL